MNLASRLMAVAKDRAVGLAVSAAAVADDTEAATTHLTRMVYSAAVPIRGRQAPVDLWLGPYPAQSATTAGDAAGHGSTH